MSVKGGKKEDVTRTMTEPPAFGHKGRDRQHDHLSTGSLATSYRP